MASMHQFLLRHEQNITRQLELIRDFREDIQEFQARGGLAWLAEANLADKSYTAEQFVAAIGTVAAFLGMLDPGSGTDEADRSARTERLANLYRLKQ